MSLGEILFNVRQGEDGFWRVYYLQNDTMVTACGRHSTEQEAKRAAIDFFDA